MPLAKKATLNDAHIKVLVWGESGSGKSRFALSAPNPLVVDLEGSTRLYANDFDFLRAEVDVRVPEASNPGALVNNIIKEIIANQYPDAKTLIIDPLTDLLDWIENFCATEYEKQIGKKITDLNAIQKTKWYAYRKETSRKTLDKLKNLPMNLILVARSKNMWDTKDGKLQPVGQTYDCLEIVEYLMDIVINLEKKENEIVAKVKKSRLANLPEVLPVRDFNSILNAIKETKTSSEPEEKEEKKIEDNTMQEVFESVVDEITSSDTKFNYEDMKRLEEKHLKEQE